MARVAFLLFGISLFFGALAPASPSASEGIAPCLSSPDGCRVLDTDLGPLGNTYVRDTFEKYRQLHPSGSCHAEGNGRRVIVTGYGLFSGIKYNISGSVVASLGRKFFWPVRFPGARPAPGTVSDDDAGAVVYNRELNIRGRKYEVCLMVEDVVWDLAAGILVHEASHFQPDMILMTGRGGAEGSFEAGAVNDATAMSGYDSEGRPLDGRSPFPMNIPQDIYVLPNHETDARLTMNWDGATLARAVEPLVTSLGYKVSAATDIYTSNNYLCNNISFVALNATMNLETKLAGGQLVFPAGLFPKRPIVGFFHFPAVDGDHPDLNGYRHGIFDWDRVLSLVIATALNP